MTTPTPKSSDLRRLLAAQPQDQLDDLGFQAMAQDQLAGGGYRLTQAELEAWRSGADFYELCAVSRRECER